MKKVILLSVFLGFLLPREGESQNLPWLRVSDDRQYIVTENGQPFIWLGATAWEMIHRLNREEITWYLEDCASKGFTVIQTVVLAELDGLNTPNAYGDRPLTENDPSRFNEAYFNHVDFAIRKASELGLYIGLLPTWGDKFNKKWGVGPEIFTPSNAEIYGELIARRYLGFSNIIWILGGDRIPENETHSLIVRAMAKGIRKIDTKHLITYHPWGGVIASQHFDDPWLDLDMFQTTHDRRARDFEFVAKARTLSPGRPIINGEPRYENIPDRLDGQARFGWMDDSDVRSGAYWTMLSGAAGYTYGCNDIWQMYSSGRSPVILARTDWQQAVHLPGSTQIFYMKKLITSFPWQEMKTDPSLLSGENPADSSYIVCSIGKKQDFILAYTPMGKPIKPDLSRLKCETVSAFWFNPRSGKFFRIGEYKTTDKPSFIPWSVGRGSDFVLILKDKKSVYPIPE
jgi:hypothetical protein